MFLLSLTHQIKPSWLPFIYQQAQLPYFIKLNEIVKNAYDNTTVYPKKAFLFKCFTFFEVKQTRLVILGQDPYYLKDVADGLAFSTSINFQPKSLKNIFLEIKNDFHINRTNFNLADIASQNVLLFNTILTVIENKPLSHQKIGWQIFAKNLLHYLSIENQNVIYLLMGNHAIAFKSVIQNALKIFETSHPSPLGYYRNLKNSHTFKAINDLLKKNHFPMIQW